MGRSNIVGTSAKSTPCFCRLIRHLLSSQVNFIDITVYTRSIYVKRLPVSPQSRYGPRTGADREAAVPPETLHPSLVSRAGRTAASWSVNCFTASEDLPRTHPAVGTNRSGRTQVWKGCPLGGRDVEVIERGVVIPELPLFICGSKCRPILQFRAHRTLAPFDSCLGQK